MSLPQYLLYEKGGTVHIDVPFLPLTATVRIVDGRDGEKLAHTAANVSLINTTLNVAASSLNSQISVLSNTGIAVGKTMWIQDDPEEVLVRAVSGGTVSLRRPLFYGHVNAARVEGARLETNIPSTACTSMFWDGRCEWNIDGTYYYTAVECVRFPNQRTASAQDLFDCEPKIADLVDSETDVERLLDNAHELVMGEIARRAPDHRARVFTGTNEFKSTTAAAAMYLHFLRRSQATEEREVWWRELERRLDSVVSSTPRDANQDGVIGDDERMSMRSVTLVR